MTMWLLSKRGTAYEKSGDRKDKLDHSGTDSLGSAHGITVIYLLSPKSSFRKVSRTILLSCDIFWKSCIIQCQLCSTTTTTTSRFTRVVQGQSMLVIVAMDKYLNCFVANHFVGIFFNFFGLCMKLLA